MDDQRDGPEWDAVARQGPGPHQGGVAGTWRAHASHERLALERGGDGDGACLVEPAVRCTHCGYCVSYGH